MRIHRTTPAPTSPEAGSRPTSQAMQHWRTDTERQAAISAFVAERGEIGRAEAVLCSLYWVERVERRLAAAAVPETPALNDQRAIAATEIPTATSACEISTLYSAHNGRRLRGVTDFLARLTRVGLVEAIGEGWYRTTALGRAVVEALPDVTAVARLRGTRVRRALSRDAGDGGGR